MSTDIAMIDTTTSFEETSEDANRDQLFQARKLRPKTQIDFHILVDINYTMKHTTPFGTRLRSNRAIATIF